MSRRGRVGLAAAVLVVITAAVGGVALWAGGDDPAPAAATTDVPTATVKRGTLAQAKEVPGELAFGSARPITGNGDGLLTWLPSAGVTVRRGEQLYRVDDAPVTLFYGSLPLYRMLSDHALDAPPPDGGGEENGDGGGAGDGSDAGDGGDPPAPPPFTIPTGNDVDLVAQNLAALGFYDGPTTDARYDDALASAVGDWQESIGVDDTGVLAPSDVVVTTGPVRVDGLTAQAGTTAAQEILTVTGIARVVLLRAPIQLARSLSPGKRITVTLPDGSRARTRITSIGTDAIADDNGGEPTVAVRVRPVKATALKGVPLGPVTARVVTAAHRDVLSVPVGALVALSGGGYAVERPDHELVPVTVGMVAEGRVEVTGIEEDAEVVIAR